MARRGGAGPRDGIAALARGADRRAGRIGDCRCSRLYRQEPARLGLAGAATNAAVLARGRGMAARAVAMTDNVEREIARTRGELTLTLAALERKLAARYLFDEGLAMLKDTLGEDYGLNRSLEMVRTNPIPVALIGIGAAWLIANNTNAVDRIARDERIQA